MPFDDEFYKLWSEWDSASRNIECALPSQMSAAMEREVAARVAFSEYVFRVGRSKAGS